MRDVAGWRQFLRTWGGREGGERLVTAGAVALLVHQRRAWRRRLLRIHDGGEVLVLHLDELDGIGRGEDAVRYDQRDRLAVIAHLTDSEDAVVGDDVPEPGEEPAQVVGGHYGDDARGGLRRGGVDGDDLRVRAVGPQYLRVQAARRHDVDRVHGPAGHLLQQVAPLHGPASDPPGGVGGGPAGPVRCPAHRAISRMRRAASRTACTIGS